MYNEAICRVLPNMSYLLLMCKHQGPISLEQLFITLFGQQLFTSNNCIGNERRRDDVHTPDESGPVVLCACSGSPEDDPEFSLLPP